MNAITWTVSFTGTPDADDTFTAKQIIFLENQRRAPGNQLPSSTAAEVKASYLALMLALVQAQHLTNWDTAKNSGLQQRFTAAEQQAITQNLLTRLQNGESSATIVTDTAS